MKPHTPPRPEIIPIPELATRLQRIMKRNATDADYIPFSAIARHIDIHRDTIYEAAKGVAVGRVAQILLSRFLLRLEAGELEARQVDVNGRYEIFPVENPKPRRLLRFDINLAVGSMRLTQSPYQPPPRMPSFAGLFCIK